ncbi:MAG TPA: hypothetical protein VG146_09705 [Verrucomicrobiae bacterium]|nr:hypothetical protein [Verrucomicrobiae bacterium]
MQRATASDPDGYVTNVEFFANGADLGRGLPLATDPPSPIGIAYYLAWSDSPAGNYALTAVVTDNGGLSATSAPVKISVVNSPPPTNVPPAVRIDSPTNGATFLAPVDIPIFASAGASSGLAAIEFR